ncbi:MAG: HEAT repeat domain-containing protein [Planctomycetes bacterium]|nr:HEAT repeat domain-containing protein [Planctomycetota bacterium]
MVENPPKGSSGTAENDIRGFLCSDLELAKKLSAALSVLQIPTGTNPRADGKAYLIVPAQFAERASQSLSSAPGVALEQEGPEPFLRKFDPEKDAKIYDHPVFKQPVPELKKRAQAAIDELLHCVKKGSPQVVERAIATLGRLGRDGHAAVDQLAVLAVQTGNPAFVGLLVRDGKLFEGRSGEKLPESLRPIHNLIKHSSPAVRQQAVRVLGGIRVAEVIPDLAAALMDASEDVAIEADDAFLNLGAPDDRFEPDMEKDEIREIVEKRKSFRPK